MNRAQSRGEVVGRRCGPDPAAACGWLVSMMKETLAAIAVGGLLLAGCGAGTTEVARTEVPPVPTASASPQTSDEPVDSTTASASPSDGAMMTSAAPTASAAPSTSAVASQSAAPTQAPKSTGVDTSVSTPAVSTPPAKPTPPSAAPTKAPVGGSWAVMDVTVTTAAQSGTLSQTSADFQAFVAGLVTSPDASGCVSEITVLAFHPNGFAAGQDFAPGCGGSQNIWGKVGGTWKTIMTMQSVVPCTEMKANNVPQGLPDIPCLDANGGLADW